MRERGGTHLAVLEEQGAIEVLDEEERGAFAGGQDVQTLHALATQPRLPRMRQPSECAGTQNRSRTTRRREGKQGLVRASGMPR